MLLYNKSDYDEVGLPVMDSFAAVKARGKVSCQVILINCCFFILVHTEQITRHL